MADIFVSYSRNDRDRVHDIVTGLERRGWSVWWDPNIIPGERYANTIDAELKAAKCVVAVWSESSAASDWVQEEAEDGKARGVLVPVLIDDIPIPRGFRRIQTVDLGGWKGDERDLGWVYVLAAVKRCVEGGPAPAIKPPKTRRQKRMAIITNIVALLLLGVIAGGVWWSATHPAQALAITQNTFISNIINIFTGGGAVAGGDQGGGKAAKLRSAGGEREPNDAQGQAIALALNRSIRGEISEQSDVDFFRIETTSAPRNVLSIRIDNESDTLRPQIRVLNADGSELFSAYDSTGGADLERSLPARPGETLYLVVSQFTSSTGAYRLMVSNDTRHSAAGRIVGAAVEREPNNTVFEAVDIAWGRPLLGHLHRGNEEDHFRVVAPGNVTGEVNLIVRSLSTELAPNVTLYDSNKAEMFYRYASTKGADVATTFTPERGATYFVKVSPFSDGEGDYVLEIGR